MTDGLLVVNFGALQQAAADIQHAVSALDAQLGDLERDAAPLVQTWDGAAKEAYAQRQNAWRTASEDLKAILHGVKCAVEKSAADYQDTERRATNLF